MVLLWVAPLKLTLGLIILEGCYCLQLQVDICRLFLTTHTRIHKSVINNAFIKQLVAPHYTTGITETVTTLTPAVHTKPEKAQSMNFVLHVLIHWPYIISLSSLSCLPSCKPSCWQYPNKGCTLKSNKTQGVVQSWMDLYLPQLSFLGFITSSS